MANGSRRRQRRGGAGDGLGVDAVMAVEIGDGARLTEMLDAERARAMTRHRAEPTERRRMAVDDGDEAAMRRQRLEQPFDMRTGMDEPALARPARRRPAGIEAVGRCDREEADIAPVLGEEAGRRDRLRRHRTLIGDDEFGIRPRLAQPIGAVDDGAGKFRRQRPLRLLDRPGRKAEIERAARFVAQPCPLVRFAVSLGALDIVEAEAENRREFVDESRLEGGEPVLREADQRRSDRLVRAAFRRQRDPGWRRDEDEAGILVAGIVERVGAAIDEGIIERADRQQPLAIDGMREPERREHQEEVHLGDA